MRLNFFPRNSCHIINNFLVFNAYTFVSKVAVRSGFIMDSVIMLLGEKEKQNALSFFQSASY